MDFRSIVTAELKKQGLTKYRLWKICKGNVGWSTISDFLSGKKDILSKNLAVIFESLGIKVKK